MKKIVKTLVNALVSSQLDYCNALYYRLPNSAFFCLQNAKYFNQACILCP